MLDRTLEPPVGKVSFDGLPKVNKQILGNHIPLIWLNAGDQPVVKIQIVLQAGIWYEQKKAVSWLCAKMLTEGTRSKSSNDISAGFESLGAFLEINPGFDDVSISVYGLKRNFEQVINLLSEILNESIFPEQEFETLRSNRRDQVLLNDNKNSLFASKKLREAIFGPIFPYGQGLAPEDVDRVGLEEVKAYYATTLFNQPKIFVAGSIDDKLIKTLEHKLSMPLVNVPTQDTNHFASNNRHIYVEREASMQSSIRMAWLIPDRSHKDYFKYEITNALLGGYFGSRLMKNIREEKGYTYGIHAYPVHLKQSSFGMIAGDVIAKHTEDTFNEINFEIDRLLNEPIPADELETLTNYLAGSFLSSINTPFQLMSKFKIIEESGLDEIFFQRYFEELKSIGQAEIKAIIDLYFKPKEAFTTIVGTKS